MDLGLVLLVGDAANRRRPNGYRTLQITLALNKCPVDAIIAFEAPTLDEAETRVGRIDAFELEGLELWFNSSDHLPPHIHVKRRGEWEIRVFFLLCTGRKLEFNRKWGRKDPSTAIQEKIRKAVVKHRARLLEEWEQKVCTS